MKKLNKNKIIFQKTSVDQEPQIFTVFAGQTQAHYWRGEIVPLSYMDVVDYSQQAIYDEDAPEVRVIARKDVNKNKVVQSLKNILYFIEAEIEEMNQPGEEKEPPHNVYTFVPTCYDLSDVFHYGQYYFCECFSTVDGCHCDNMTMQNNAKDRYDYGMDFIINQPMDEEK